VNEVTITIPVDTVNAALAALSKFPYEQAQPHIDLLRSRASAALESAQPTPAEAELVQNAEEQA
jgi:hypothetical protein